MMESKAFVIVSPDYPPHEGGVERYSFHIAGELRKRGYAVYVISSSMKGVPDEETDSRGVVIWRLPSCWVIKDRMPVPLPTGKWRMLAEELRQYDSVKVIAQTNLYFLSLKGILFAESNGWNAVMIIHGSNYVCQGDTVVDHAEHIYERFLARQAKKHRAKFAAVSKAGASFAGRLGCKVETIAYNAIDYAEIDAVQTSSTSSVRRQLQLSEDTVLFIFVGRLIKEKGVLQLAEAFSRFQLEHEETALLILGDGPLMSELKDKRVKHLFLMGQRSHDEVIALLKQSDCFILPSDSEGFPTTVLEAAACGAYVIASPYGGTQEAVQLVGGVLMKDNSSEEVQRSLQNYWENKEELKKSVSKKKNSFRQDVNWAKTTDDLIRLME